MNKKSLVITVFLVFALNGIGLAQDEEYEHDILEIGIHGGLGIPLGGITEWETGQELDNPVERGADLGWDAGLDIGWFASAHVILGASFVFTEFPIDTDQDTQHNHKIYSVSLYGKYLFEGESNWVPYVKVQAGLDNLKFSSFVENTLGGRRYRELSYDPTLAVGIGGGLFYYTADYSGLYLEGTYHTAFSNDIEGTYLGTDYNFGETATVVDVNFGIRILVGPGE